VNRVERAKALYLFLLENLHLSPAEFILKNKSKLADDVQFAASQLNGLRRAKKKLPSWFKNDAILYPPNLNIEQSSSELMASYKKQFFKGLKTSVDLTGGFGVDSWAIAQEADKHTYIEPNVELLEIVKSNFSALKIQNTEFKISTAEDWLEQNQEVDAIYLDPSRRVEGQKKFKLTECVPDVVALQERMLTQAKRVIIKLSPLADLKAILSELKGVAEIHVVAVKNEMKEVLVLLNRACDKEAQIHCVNFTTDNNKQEFSFKIAEESQAEAQLSAVKDFIYEPNASILKAGAFKLVAQKFGLQKLNANTHLYTASHVINNFPGKVFKISDDRPKKVNVISRNHPMKPTQLAKKYKVKEGALDNYLLAFKDIEKPKVVFAKLLT
jgi:16S rRNA G966 N2-methylase RsmD